MSTHKKDTLILVVGCLLFLGFKITAFAQEIIWEDIGRGNLNLKVVLVDAHNPRIIYIGLDKEVSRTEDGGKTWQRILSVSGQNKRVNFLLLEPRNKYSLYAATESGLFYSANQGKRWKRIFKGKNYLENQCTTLAVLPDALYLGTKAGLFVSSDQGRSWFKASGELGNNYILAIAYHLQAPDYLYLASLEGVFSTRDKGQSWEKIFVAHPQEVNNDYHAEEIENEDEETTLSHIRYIALDPHHLNHLYLGTAKGVYRSEDRGKTWQLLSDYGLLNQEVNFLLISHQSHLYAVTESGVFTYRQDKWHELSLRLPAQKINFLTYDHQDNLYAAGNQGLFKAHLGHFTNDVGENIISIYAQDEPTINEVQKAAISYAEVSPEKIKRWRKQAARKAFLPRVSVGIDRNTTDLWHWEGGSTTRTDDDILRRGRDSIDWDVTLSWDLGELIWNDDQTSIDVRSKLMVQLRDDVLDEVTKLYFERIRVKMELDNLSLEDRKNRFNKELRLQELTASIDALTGGSFSKKGTGP